jgi:hypothetical protein
MPENPYEPPKTGPQGNAKRQRLVLALLTGLTVPAATIAGSTLCTVMRQGMAPNGSIWLAIAAGTVASFAVLVASDWYRQRQTSAPSRPAYRAAAMGMALATPIALALLLGGGALVAYSPLELPRALAVGSLVVVASFLILSLGGWIAIRRRRRSGVK